VLGLLHHPGPQFWGPRPDVAVEKFYAPLQICKGSGFGRALGPALALVRPPPPSKGIYQSSYCKRFTAATNEVHICTYRSGASDLPLPVTATCLRWLNFLFSCFFL